MSAEEPQQSQAEPTKPVNWQLAVLCIALGLLCPVLPFIARQLEPDVFSAFSKPINLFSLCMTFGLFLTAVGGWGVGQMGAAGTFGGAAATVVALFLLLQFFAPAPDSGREKGMVASISGVAEDTSSGLYSAITSIEVLEERGTQLFVAPNRRLKHADVLIETSNLDTHCLAFVFAPNQESQRVDGAAEAVTVKIPSDFFRQSMKSAAKQKRVRHRVKLFYHHLTGTLLRTNPATEGSGEPLERAWCVCGYFPYRKTRSYTAPTCSGDGSPLRRPPIRTRH